MGRKQSTTPQSSRRASAAGILATLFCWHQFAQDAVLVGAFAPSAEINHGQCQGISFEHGYLVGERRQSPQSSSALSAAFQAENIPTQATASTEKDNAPAFLIEGISQIPTNERLFHRISNMCIDVFFKELLLDEQGEQTDAARTRKRDKFL